MKRRIITFVLAALSVVCLGSCTNKNNSTTSEDYNISILATSDVHCGVKDGLGYDALSEYRNQRKNEGYETTLIDCGDVIQGDTLGVLTRGSDIIDIINKLGVEAFTLGNHEFDYGMEQLSTLVDKFNGDVLSCNLEYIGDNENKLDKVKPYTIIDYDDVKIGYVGVTTPESFTSSTPSVFMEDGEYAYTFNYDTTEQFYNKVQKSIDDCKKDGADYIIMMCHLGFAEEFGGASSIALMNNTHGYDLVLDGHAHKEYQINIEDSNGDKKPLCCLGTKLSCFAEVIITENGLESVELVKEYDGSDTEVLSYIDHIFALNEEMLTSKITTSDLSISIYYENGIRMSRNGETQVGNFYADSYMYKYNTDISFVNAGGLRAGFDEGDINYSVLYKMAPFGNFGVVIEATGQQILNYLEFGAKDIKNVRITDGMAVGENGGLAIPSGLKYTIDTSIESSCVVDEKGMLVSIGDTRRVKDVYVLENGSYVALDTNKTYTISGIAYVLTNNGDGNTAFNGCKVIEPSKDLDVEIMKEYFIHLNGDVKSKYENVEGRINVI